MFRDRERRRRNPPFDPRQAPSRLPPLLPALPAAAGPSHLQPTPGAAVPPPARCSSGAAPEGSRLNKPRRSLGRGGGGTPGKALTAPPGRRPPRQARGQPSTASAGRAPARSHRASSPLPAPCPAYRLRHFEGCWCFSCSSGKRSRSGCLASAERPVRRRWEREEEEGAAPGHGGSTARECVAGRPAAVKYAGGAAAVTHRRRPLPAAPPLALSERGTGLTQLRRAPRPASPSPGARGGDTRVQPPGPAE